MLSKQEAMRFIELLNEYEKLSPLEKKAFKSLDIGLVFQKLKDIIKVGL